MGILGIVWKIVTVSILAMIGLGAYLYFSDYTAEAVVTETGEDSAGPFVVIKPTLLPYDYKTTIDEDSARFVCEGYKVLFQVKSQHYQVLDTKGKLIYDSVDGLQDITSAVQCASTKNTGGPGFFTI